MTSKLHPTPPTTNTVVAIREHSREDRRAPSSEAAAIADGIYGELHRLLRRARQIGTAVRRMIELTPPDDAATLRELSQTVARLEGTLFSAVELVPASLDVNEVLNRPVPMKGVHAECLAPRGEPSGSPPPVVAKSNEAGPVTARFLGGPR